MNRNKEIIKYLLENPDKQNRDYANTAAMFGTNYEQGRSVARKIRGAHSNNKTKKKEKLSMEEGPEGRFIIAEDTTRVKSLDDLLKAFSEMRFRGVINFFFINNRDRLQSNTVGSMLAFFLKSRAI